MLRLVYEAHIGSCSPLYTHQNDAVPEKECWLSYTPTTGRFQPIGLPGLLSRRGTGISENLIHCNRSRRPSICRRLPIRGLAVNKASHLVEILTLDLVNLNRLPFPLFPNLILKHPPSKQSAHLPNRQPGMLIRKTVALTHQRRPGFCGTVAHAVYMFRVPQS